MTIFIRNTGTTLRPAEKRGENDFFDLGSTVYFLRNRSGKIIAAQSAGMPAYLAGSHENVTLETNAGDRYYGIVEIIGGTYDGEDYGVVPTKTVPFYVFK